LGTVHLSWPFAGTGMATTLCNVPSRAVSVAMIPSVSGGAGMVSGLAGRHAHVDIGQHALHAELRVLLSDLAARKPAGVVGFILEPNLHPPLLGLLDHELHLRHVLPGVRYSGTPRPGETFTMKTLLDLSRSRSSTILAFLSLASGRSNS